MYRSMRRKLLGGMLISAKGGLCRPGATADLPNPSNSLLEVPGCMGHGSIGGGPHCEVYVLQPCRAVPSPRALRLLSDT
jgi:hypothetical protein